jgi:phage terminase small subunit
MARDRLTARQDRFARLYASGQFSKTKAYQEAGYMPNGSKKVLQVEACKLSSKPHVAQAISKYQAQLLPLETMHAEAINAIRSLKTLSASPRISGRIRLQATLKLYEICSERERVEAQELPRGPSLNVDRLINEILRELRRAGEQAKGLELDESHEGLSSATKRAFRQHRSSG